MKDLVVIVTGERDWLSKEQIFDELEALRESLLPGQRMILRHGVSGNTDTWANEWGLAHKDQVHIERFRADWHLPGGGVDYSAGPRRNEEMAAAEPRADLCLAFWSGTTKRRGNRENVSGTLSMIQAALRHVIRVTVVPPRGSS